MKTKTIFMLAAMLLISMGAFAQSNEPLEGDVNKDGKVDVADIVKVIDIMAAGEQPQPTVYYWYVGYNQDAYDNPETFKDYMYTTTTNATPTEYSKDGSNGLDISNTGEHPNYLNMILPSSWDVPTLWDETKQGQILGSILKENVVIKGLEGTYKVWGGDGNGVNDNIIYIN